MASFPGSILGAGILVIALEVLRSIAEFRKAFIGITIILLLIFRPQGLLSSFNVENIIKKYLKRNKRIEIEDSTSFPNGNHEITKELSKSKDRNPYSEKQVEGNEINKKKVLMRGINIDKNFGGVCALQSLDFELYEGEILGLIGPNGSGKTTLFNVISGIFPPTKGEVRLFDVAITKLPPYVIASHKLQRTFQNVRLFKRLSVLMNVKIGAHLSVKMNLFNTMARSRKFRELEKIAEENAHFWISFVGLEHRVNELAKNLPYGEQKLLEIARSLVSDPLVLLLDEPAAGLNSKEVESLATVIRRVRDMGVTVFLVEHNMRLIMDICDRIIVINFGQTVAEGTPMDIKMNPAVQKAYLGAAEE
jgi:branched-chain amino acid transport system ATP-binding protein